MARIVIADDHIVLRQGLRALLSIIDDFEVIAEASDGFEVLPLVERERPDLLIIDLSMPNLGGIETIARLQKSKDKPRILVLSAKDDESSVSQAMRAGANGFVPKTASHEELEFAVRSVLKGQTYLSPAVCRNLIQTGLSDPDAGTPLTALSSREREIMKLLAEGHPNRNVAKVLHISPRTVDSHRANIMKKLGVTSNAELVQLALKHGMIE
jgi:DNA-binding NarL/FixJ family response regulator